MRPRPALEPGFGRGQGQPPDSPFKCAPGLGWFCNAPFVPTLAEDGSRRSLAIRRWWRATGHARYPQATRPDCGGSNGARVRLWKRELQSLANELGLSITVCHLPPGASKWNKIEHRLFSFITQNWRGKPLISYQAIVQLIAATTTETGLKVQCEIDPNTYPAACS